MAQKKAQKKPSSLNGCLIHLTQTFEISIFVQNEDEAALLQALLVDARKKQKQVIEELLMTPHILRDNPVSFTDLPNYSETSQKFIDDWGLPANVERLLLVPIKIPVERYVRILGKSSKDATLNKDLVVALMEMSDEVRHYLFFKYFAESNHYQIQLDTILAECPEAKSIYDGLVSEDDLGTHEFVTLSDEILMETGNADSTATENTGDDSTELEQETPWWWPLRSRKQKVNAGQVHNEVSNLTGRMVPHGYGYHNY